MGPYIITYSPPDPEKAVRFVFEVARDFEGEITREQTAFKDRIQNLVAACAIEFKPGSQRFRERLNELYETAKAGLEGPAASVTAAEGGLRIIERNFIENELMPRRYRRVLFVFVTVVILLIAHFFLFHDDTLIRRCDVASAAWIVCRPFQAIHGHIVGYMGLVTTISGIVVGIFIAFTIRMLTFSLDEESRQGDLSSAPLLNTIFSLIMAYIICLLIKFGKFDIQLFEVKLSDYRSNESIGFLLGFFIAIGARQYASRLLNAASPAR